MDFWWSAIVFPEYIFEPSPLKSRPKIEIGLTNLLAAPFRIRRATLRNILNFEKKVFLKFYDFYFLNRYENLFKNCQFFCVKVNLKWWAIWFGPQFLEEERTGKDHKDLP